MRRGAPFAAALAVIAACSDQYSASDSTDGGAVDATAPSSDGAAGTGDAGAEGCGHTLCESFDDGHLAQRWQVVQNGGPTVSVTTAAFVSPSNALQVFVPLGDGGARKAYLSRTFPGQASRVVVEADARIDTFGATSNWVNLFELFLTSADANVTTYVVGLSEYPSQSDSFEYAVSADGGAWAKDHTFAMIPHGQWTHVRYAFKLTSPASATFSENGVDVVTHSLDVPTFVSVEVQVGAPQVGEPGGPFTELLDNVTIDLTP